MKTPAYRALAGLILFPFLYGLCFSQHQAASSASVSVPAFEIADVHPSPPSTYPPFMHGGDLIGDRYTLRQATILDMISAAYGISRGSVSGGPSWLDWDRFDVIAMAPETTSPGNVKLMLRSLLKERFKLIVQGGTAQMPAYVLTVAEGKPKMKQSDGLGQSGCQSIQRSAQATARSNSLVEISGHNETMQSFAGEVQALAPTYLDQPVVDSTGLAGSWNFDLKWTPRNRLKQSGASAISLFDAVRNQLGLKLTLATAPAQVLNVKSVNEKPTPNALDIEKRLPRLPPAQLEVAVIRPARPEEKVFGGTHGDRFDVHAFTLKQLISFAWNLDPNDSETLVGAPKWLENNRYDIQAKVETGRAGTARSESRRIDKEQFQQLIRELLEDRFQLKAHFEDHPVTSYNLVADHPKLTNANTSERTGCETGPGPAGKDREVTDPALDRLVTCRNITMAQFGQALRGYEFGYFYFPVEDATGLKGAYDFTLSFTSLSLLQGRAPMRADPSAEEQTTVSEPTGAISLFEAIRKELGLKLEKVKRPEPVLLIDHIDEQPVPN